MVDKERLCSFQYGGYVDGVVVMCCGLQDSSMGRHQCYLEICPIYKGFKLF